MVQQGSRYHPTKINKDGETSGRELVTFRQKAKGGLTVDVTADFSHIVDKWEAKGYRRHEGSWTRSKSKRVEVNELSKFDCLACKKHIFSYNMNVWEVVVQENGGKKAKGGVKFMLQSVPNLKK